MSTSDVSGLGGAGIGPVDPNKKEVSSGKLGGKEVKSGYKGKFTGPKLNLTPLKSEGAKPLTSDRVFKKSPKEKLSEGEPEYKQTTDL